MKTIALLLTLFTAVLCVRADEYEARTFTAVDGATLPYRLLIPKNYDKAQKYPLVLFLHGAGERGDNNTDQLKHGAPLFLKPEVRDKFPCFVIAPQCPKDQTWSPVKGWTSPDTFHEEPNPPLKLALAALEAVSKEFTVDADRLYITGLSMGGYGTWDAITRAPQKWAAAAPVCGGGDATRIAAAKLVPVWAFHGLNDPTVPVERSRELILMLKGALAPAVLYSEYPYIAHDSWTTAYGEPQLLPWMFAQRRGQPPVSFVKVAGELEQPPSSEMPGAGTMQSGLWFRALWKDHRTKWAAAKDADQGAVVFFGDSITDGWGSLAKDFPNLKVANRGIGGDTTRGLRGRLQGDVLDLHPRAVSILIGTNDLDQGTEPNVVADNLHAIIAALHKADPNMPIIINKVMPRATKPGLFPEKIRALNDFYTAAFKDDPKITFCDTWTIFDAGDGQCKKEEFGDMLHPNEAGYAKWTAALTPIFEKLNVAK